MSVQAISWVLDQSQSRLRARLVLLAIANHMRRDGIGTPDTFTIACEAHLGEREVQDAIRELRVIIGVQVRRPKCPNVSAHPAK